MALRQLMISKKIEQRKALLTELVEQKEGFNTRSVDLKTALEEAKTDEEFALVEEEVTKLEGEEADLEEKKVTLEGEIADLEGELEEINNKEPNNNNDVRSKYTENMEGVKMMDKRTRELDYLQREDVKEFYSRVRGAVLDKRSLVGGDLIIPEVVLNRIQPLIGDYSALYNEVDVVTLNGSARAIVDGAKPEAIWLEMTGALTELSAAFSAVELDGFKVGGFIPVANAILEDSMIDLANYLERSLAEAIAKAIDNAILNGTGAAGKQPEGIIPAIPEGNKTTGSKLSEVLSSLALVDTGDDYVGEIIAVMKRNTYYKTIMPQTVVETSDGKQVVQGVTNPNIAGLRVVFSNYAPVDKIILGDFKQYLLGERKGVTLASSTDVKFVEDQTVFKATARYDGKPVKKSAFALVDATVLEA